MLSDYLDGQVLLVSTMSQSLIYQYETVWGTVPIGRPFGIVTGQPLVVACLEGYVVYRPDGTRGALYYGDDVRAHEIVRDKHGKLWIASPKRSALLTIDELGIYTELWRVPRVEHSDDSRAYVNGIALRNGGVRYVTALGISNESEGWRKEATERNGVVIDIADNKVIADGLFAPHSPRWADGKLYMCESGEGSLIAIDIETGAKQVIAKLPGFTRGLIIKGKYAFVGQSQGRPTNSTNAASEEMLMAQPGISVIDLTDGQEVHFEPVDTPEIFDIQLHNTLLR